MANTVDDTTETDLLMLCLSAIFLFIAAASWYFASLCKRKMERKHHKETNEPLESMSYRLEKDPTPSSLRTSFQQTHTEQPTTDIWLCSSDVRNDPNFTRGAIPHHDLNSVIFQKRTPYGTLYAAQWRGRQVSVKQMIPELAKSCNKEGLEQFMSGIRLCASLNHENIVAYCGITWTNRFDLAIVMEYMSQGDLWSLLLTQKELEDERNMIDHDWFKASTRLTFKSKAHLALDVIQALVYLHNLPIPEAMIHGHVKARHVLVNEQSEAKLSAFNMFGSGKDASLDDTMRIGEVGTVAWIAPEVIFGDPPTKQADIYSFGVLMVEMDLVQHPFRDELDTDDSSRQNTQMAMLVSVRALKPSVSERCPAPIKDLVNRCLEYNPENRPTAEEIRDELITILEVYHQNPINQELQVHV